MKTTETACVLCRFREEEEEEECERQIVSLDYSRIKRVLDRLPTLTYTNS